MTSQSMDQGYPPTHQYSAPASVASSYFTVTHDNPVATGEAYARKAVNLVAISLVMGVPQLFLDEDFRAGTFNERLGGFAIMVAVLTPIVLMAIGFVRGWWFATFLYVTMTFLGTPFVVRYVLLIAPVSPYMAMFSLAQDAIQVWAAILMCQNPVSEYFRSKA